MDEVLNGNDDRLFVRRLSDLITGRDPSGGSVVLTIDPAVQQAAYEALTSTRLRRRRGRAAPADRADPRDGLHARPTTRTSWPATAPKTRRRPGSSSTTRTRRVLTNRAISETYPPGSTFKLIDTAAALQNGFTPDSQLTAASEITLQDTATTPGELRGHAPAARARPPRCATRWPARATPPSPSSAAQLGEDKIRAPGRGVRRRHRTARRIPMTVAPSTLGDIPDTASLQQSVDRAARRPVHPAAERDDRRRDRQRRPGDGALPGPAGPQPDAGRARRDPAGPPGPGDARRRRRAR